MLVTGLVFVLGVCVGSFTNVLVCRLPESESVVSPGSRCRSCKRPLAWYENVPLLSYLALRGRCRGCGARISIQYPLVEFAVGLLFAGNFLLVGPGPGAPAAEQLRALTQPQWVAGAVFTTILLAIALTDVRTYLIPDELSVGGMVVGLALSFLPGAPRPQDAFVGALVGGALLLAVAWLGSIVFKKEAMGGGDIKMLAMIGAFIGWRGVLLTLFLGALLGSLLYGPIALWHRVRSRTQAGVARNPTYATPGVAPASSEPARQAEAPDLAEEASGVADRELVPFGFFLAPAAALAYYLADEIMLGYLRLVGLGG